MVGSRTFTMRAELTARKGINRDGQDRQDKNRNQDET
jgi:hypothetical protein